MKMSNEHIKVFTTSGCLSQEAIKNYLFIGTDIKIQKTVEDHLKKCDLCREAVEGYKLLQHFADYDGILKKINKRIEDGKEADSLVFEGNEVKTNVKYFYFVAASLAFLFLVFGYLKFENKRVMEIEPRILGEDLYIPDSSIYSGYLGNLNYLYNSIQHNFEENENGINTKADESVELKTKGEDLNNAGINFGIQENRNDLSKRNTYIMKNDMIIRNSMQPEPLESFNIPFNIYLQRKMDSLLNNTAQNYKIMAEFIINKHGGVEQPKIVSSSNSKLIEIAMQVLEESPQWKPATINGTPVDYPIRIKIEKL